MVLRAPIKFWRLSFARKWACLEAMVFLIVAKGVVKILGYKTWSKLLGPIQKPDQHELETPNNRGSVNSSGDHLSKETRWAVQTAAHALPFNFVCLPRAIAGKWMLARRKAPAYIHLGIKRTSTEGQFTDTELHAWLSVGGHIILGGEIAGEFKEIAVYGA